MSITRWRALTESQSVVLEQLVQAIEEHIEKGAHKFQAHVTKPVSKDQEVWSLEATRFVRVED